MINTEIDLKEKGDAEGSVKDPQGTANPVKKKIVIAVCLAAAVFLAVLAVCACIWTLRQWGGLSMDEIVYELNAPLEGTGNGMIESFLLQCLLPALIALVTAVILIIRFFRRGGFMKTAGITAACFAAVLVLTFAYFGYRVGFVSYIIDRNTISDFIEKNYADPKKTELEFPGKKRNLIYIYLESMETSFTDRENGGAYDENFIPELTKLAQENEDFSGTDDRLNGGYSLPGTTWTIGAMFGMTAGLPLNIEIERNSMSSQTEFFPQITTLGDILENEGYRQMLLLGSDATFGGRRLYFTQHGNYEMRDYLYAKETGLIPEDYKVWWGMEDEKLFDLAKTSLEELAAGDQPFNLTMLTVDTHFTDGYVCRLCGHEFGSNRYANVMACSSRQVAAFVEWISRQDWFEDTTIVITGDHPTMDGDFCAGIEEDYPRRTYTCYINSAAKPARGKDRRTFSTFDNFPSTLAAMGVKISGDRLGLGTNLFSSEDTLTEKFGEEFVAREVSRRTDFLEELESLDQETLDKVEKYASTVVRSEEWDLVHELISVTIGPVDLPEDNPVKYVRLKIWVDAGDQTIHRWIKTRQTEEGGYYTCFSPLKYLDGYPEIKYQFVLKFDNGETYNLAPEGTLVNLPGHTWRDGESEAPAGDAA